MKHLRIAALALGLLNAATAFAAAPIEGVWNTPTEHGQVEIYACGSAVCGRLITSDRIKANPALTDENNKDAGLRTRALKGMTLFTGFTGGSVEWRGDALYNPQDGGAYHGSIRLQDPNTLKLTGCIVAPFCSSQVWHRAK